MIEINTSFRICIKVNEYRINKNEYLSWNKYYETKYTSLFNIGSYKYIHLEVCDWLNLFLA